MLAKGVRPLDLGCLSVKLLMLPKFHQMLIMDFARPVQMWILDFARIDQM